MGTNQVRQEDIRNVKRRGLLKIGTLVAAFTGASAISGRAANASPEGMTPPVAYVPLAEKGTASGVATLDTESKIPPAQIPDLSATYESGTTTVLYVSPSGSNSGSGKTRAKAKATIGGALAALAGGAGVIEVDSGTITETALWGTVPGNTVIRGRSKRATTILKGVSGNLATLADGAEIHDMTIDGQGATYKGYGFLITGTAGNQIFTGVTLKNFDGPCLDFAVAAGSGFKATNLEAYRVDAGTGTGRYAINISDTQQLAAVPRSFVALTTAGQCAINFGGCNDTQVANSFISDLRFTRDSRGVNIVTTRIANQAELTVDGHNNSIVSCDISPVVTIAAGADAITVGPGSFNKLPVIDNSGNPRNNITHWAIAYTPTISSGGVAPSLGNGTLTGSWARSGTQVTINIEMTVGSTTTLGTGGLRFSLPKARTSGTITSVGIGLATGGATCYTYAVRIPGAVGYCELIRDTTGSVTYNSPAVFATGDTFRFTGTYMI